MLKKLQAIEMTKVLLFLILLLSLVTLFAINAFQGQLKDQRTVYREQTVVVTATPVPSATPSAALKKLPSLRPSK